MMAMICHSKQMYFPAFYATLLNYILKLRRTKILVSMDHLFMMIFPHQVVPREISMAINYTFDLLSEPWCYQNNRFTISCLKVIYSRLDLPDRIYIQQGCAQCSSEYAFIVMCVKLATGITTVTLSTEFGEFNDQCVSEMYHMMISMVDSKAEGILHGPTTMGRWVASFPDFASRIEWKLVQEEYGGLLFDNSASLVLSIAR